MEMGSNEHTLQVDSLDEMTEKSALNTEHIVLAELIRTRHYTQSFAQHDTIPRLQLVAVRHWNRSHSDFDLGSQ